MQEENFKSIEEEFKEALTIKEGNDPASVLLFEDFERSAQDSCENIIETLLRNEYLIPRDRAEDVAANICRRILPYLKNGVQQW